MDHSAGWANPSSLHCEGVSTAKKLKQARIKSANFLNCRPEEIVFTSGGTESNNLAIFGVANNYCTNKHQIGEIIVSAIEHKSVLAPTEELKKAGWVVKNLSVDQEGLVSPIDLKNLLTTNTVLVSVMLANNEIGTIQPIIELAKEIRRFRKQHKTSYPYLHTDACQATNYLDLNVAKLGVDFLTLNSTKIGESASVGLLYIKKGTNISPVIFGGGQEGGLRAGTENVEAIDVFASALEKTNKTRLKESERLIALRDHFISEIQNKIPNAQLNGSAKKRLPNNVNFSFTGCDGEQLVLRLDAEGIACSSGSACATNTGSVSYVIMALGFNKKRAESAIRFSFGPETTRADIDCVIKTLLKLMKIK